MDVRQLMRRRGTLAGLAVAALAFTGCGGDDPMTAEEPQQQAAPAATPDSTGGDETPSPSPESTPASTPEADVELAAGVYRPYAADAVADAGFDTTIIFFHASWCPECRAFEQAIESSEIPAGVQILKADYDTESELKQKYDVTIQTTFVRVDEDGEELSSWVGYQKDRSVETILAELS